MDVKPKVQTKKSKKKSGSLLDPFTRTLLLFLGFTLPVLAYLILRPSPQTQQTAIQQTKEFASFIQTKPELAKRSISSEPVPKAKPLPIAQNSIPTYAPPANVGQETVAPDPNTALTLDDRVDITNMSAQWNQPDFARNNVWRDQIESMFAIAERTQSTDVYDLLRRQVILGRVDEDPSNRVRAETWFERYMKIETRPVPRKEMEDLFLHQNQ